MAASQRRAVVADGYESPTEDNQPSFFFGSTPTASGTNTPARISFSAPNLTAAFLAQGSRRPHLSPYPAGRDVNHDAAQLSQTPPNLDTVILDKENQALPRRVGLRDRIACYQWTFFTMV
ncbi:hypothetical protein ACHAPV_002172 [Trichoderma viride]